MKIIYLGDPFSGYLQIKIGGINLTENYYEEDRLRKSIRVSGYVLVWWFIGSWEALFNDNGIENSIDWRYNHCMPAAGGGYIWPYIIFIGKGNNIIISCSKTDIFINSIKDYSISKQEFKEEITVFIDNIIKKIKDKTYNEELRNIEEYKELCLWWDDIKTS